MKLILYQATITITEIDFVPGPFRCQIELGHLDFAVVGGMKISLHSPGQALAGCEPEEGGRPVCENGGRY